MKRYDMIVRQSGTRMEEGTDGDFVLADEAQAAIESLQDDLDLYRDTLQAVVTSELPPCVPDEINPDEFVMLCLTHMEHRFYRDAVRVAAALIGMKQKYE